jgi:hypothetical protein
MLSLRLTVSETAMATVCAYNENDVLTKPALKVCDNISVIPSE